MKCESQQQFALYEGILTLAEVRDGELMKCSIELVSEARRLADETKCGNYALLVGRDVEKHASVLAGYGADIIYVIDDPLLEKYTTESYAKVICQAVDKICPDIFLVPATTIGRALAPRCAARLKTGLNADCTLLHVGSKNYRQYLAENSSMSEAEMDSVCGYTNLKMTMPAFGGHLMATITCPDYRPQMATVRPGVMKAGEYDEKKALSAVIEHPEYVISGEDFLVSVEDVVKEIKSCIDLTKADVIVSVGMGIRSDYKKGIELAEELAESLGGVVGCTRDVMTEGWLGEEHMVGQTGKIVKPKIYIALGISGAIQHIGGMKESGFIVAVNKDKRAPIGDIADVFICGDLFEVLPEMIKTAKEK